MCFAHWMLKVVQLGFYFQMLRNCYCADEFDLQYVQILFRHGDRSPIHLYPTDPNPETFWAEGPGKLTELGRRQHYLFGKVLREKYKNFISTSPLEEISIRSSDCDRCIKSAETNVASFYAPKEKWKFESDVNWQPLTVNYIPQKEDRYLETDSYCPEAVKEQKRIIMSEEGQKFIAENAGMFNNLSHFSGSSIKNWTSAAYLFDTLFIEKRYNLTIPAWAELYWDQLHNVSDLSFYWSFKSPLLLRLRAGPLISLIVENMGEKVSGQSPHLKIQIFSAHDTNVAVVMQALGIFNYRQPPYCAALVFELYKLRGSERYATRLLFYNSSTPESGAQSPHVLTLSGCSEYCPLEFFFNCTRSVIPKNWKKDCDSNPQFVFFSDTSLIIAMFVFGITILLLVSVYRVFRKLYRQQKFSGEYSYQLMASE